ncbi:MAG: cobalt ECF transporter T component CbiQ [Planctomycetes bacterium]|nr:cobalt ECF transporter T component CbiQ [Planctomycetota bacterium]
MHRLDARGKALAVLAYASVVATLPVGEPAPFLVLAAWPVGLLAAARVPPRVLLGALVAASPFVLLAAVFLPFSHAGGRLLWSGPWGVEVTSAGVRAAVAVVARSSLCLAATLALVATTRFGDLVAALERLGLPAVLGLTLGFVHRFLFVCLDLVRRVLCARAARSPRLGPGAALRSAGGMVASLFVRSYERSERVHAAMMARGFTGRVRPMARPRWRTADLGFLAFTAALLAAACVLEGRA